MFQISETDAQKMPNKYETQIKKTNHIHTHTQKTTSREQVAPTGRKMPMASHPSAVECSAVLYVHWPYTSEKIPMASHPLGNKSVQQDHICIGHIQVRDQAKERK